MTHLTYIAATTIYILLALMQYVPGRQEIETLIHRTQLGKGMK